MNSSGNFLGMERFLEGGMKNCPFGFININKELIYIKPWADIF